ncbi:MAG: ABC transporter permease [Mahellales bacterium]|jgi:ribose/xylose/arabinose/galactoside ABC-type transport system permease subunit
MSIRGTSFKNPNNINVKGEQPIKVKMREMLKNSSDIMSLIIALIILCVVFSLISPHFFKVQNILNIGIAASIMGIMAAGLTVAMLLGGMDVSQYAIVAVVGTVIAMMVRANQPIGLAIAAGIAVSIGCGAINGFSVAILKISPIITTLATMLIYRGLAYYLTEAKTLMVTNNFLNTLGRGYTLGVPNTVWIMVVIYILIYYLLKYTAYGRKVFAVGGNPQASFLSGINLKQIRFWAFVVSAGAAGLAGVTMVAQVGAAMPNVGETALMDVITAVILGGISLSGGKGKISGTLMGVLILATLNNGMVLVGIQSFYQMIVKGFVILLAVYIDVLRGGGFK